MNFSGERRSDTAELISAEAREVRTRWEALGLPGLVDIHTHFMPESVLRKVWSYFDAVGPTLGQDWPITYRLPESERIEILQGFGVRTFTSLNYAHRPEMASWLNEYSSRLAGEVSEVAMSATFYPEPAAAEYVAQALDRGARVFKVHVQVGAFDPGDALLDPAWEMLAVSGTPVVIHCGSGPSPGEFTGPVRIERLLRRFPGLRLVIAHLGMPEYADFLDLAARFDGVYLDTTMVFTDFIEGLHPFPRDRLGQLKELQDSIVLGTDFPNIPYRYAHALDSLINLGMGEDWLRAVLHHNGSRLLGTAGAALPE
ncbi:amidohydrolase [Nesterenkonia sp. E16_7]|uniref:amidohydrolase family protein n=1 Tax=unclassified Nesterenkonia TaxID=2629769 RepID=UPI001A929B00|nr:MULTISPECIES: amidohydrolase family protein [unclassified Nesterenkonia]MBO0595240.1 amidohydrolase [Nesterenkonia sp. E16_10]MBO0599815.1 amidohydrolase [Nesterenkonia sp. E16_7]